jgi:hypothetical protein
VANTTNAALRCAHKPLPHKLEQNPWVTVFIFAKNFILLVVLVGLIQTPFQIGIWEDGYGLPIFWKFLSWGVWVWVVNLPEVSGFGLPIFWRFLVVWCGGYGCWLSGVVVMVAGCLVQWGCDGGAVVMP